ncbi:MAG: hypothetical protein EXS64_13785 [Candidatus Latescibacteria bacterium]|nr:hypothetical protein [Candidatus Latescibacterota bacterium]
MSNQESQTDKSSFVSSYLVDLRNLEAFVELAWGGLDYALHATQIAKIIHDSPYLTPDEDEIGFEKRKKHLERLEGFAHSEDEHEFPYLYALASIRLWSIL